MSRALRSTRSGESDGKEVKIPPPAADESDASTGHAGCDGESTAEPTLRGKRACEAEAKKSEAAARTVNRHRWLG